MTASDPLKNLVVAATIIVIGKNDAQKDDAETAVQTEKKTIRRAIRRGGLLFRSKNTVGCHLFLFGHTVTPTATTSPIVKHALTKVHACRGRNRWL